MLDSFDKCLRCINEHYAGNTIFNIKFSTWYRSQPHVIHQPIDEDEVNEGIQKTLEDIWDRYHINGHTFFYFGERNLGKFGGSWILYSFTDICPKSVVNYTQIDISKLRELKLINIL